MARTRATVRRLRQPTFVPGRGQRIGNKNIMNKKSVMFKIKTLLPQTNKVEVTKNAQVIRRMNIRRNHIISLVTEDCSFKIDSLFNIKVFYFKWKQNFVVHY